MITMNSKGQGIKCMERFGNFVFQTLAFSLQPLAFASVAEILGKFGGADQLRNSAPQLPEPEMSFF
jgi:hypothetical protein